MFNFFSIFLHIYYIAIHELNFFQTLFLFFIHKIMDVTRMDINSIRSLYNYEKIEMAI